MSLAQLNTVIVFLYGSTIKLPQYLLVSQKIHHLLFNVLLLYIGLLKG